VLPIRSLVDYCLNPCIDKELSTFTARLIGAVKRSPFGRNAIFSSEGNSIDLSMYCNLTTSYLINTSAMQTVRHPSRSPVVTCGDDTPISD
jgi:hypothetical protein